VRLDWLRPLYDGPGGYVSVYMDTSLEVKSSPGEIGLRWRAARERVARLGADARTLDEIESLLTDPDREDPDRGAPGRAIFAKEGAIRLAAPLVAPPRREIARYAPLPHLMPLLAHSPPPIPHILVSVNREGGEVVTPDASELVTGELWPVHKPSAGGSSQARYQRSAEETWDENAKRVAEQVAAALTPQSMRGARVVIAGDVRARSLLLEHLPTAAREGAIIIDREIPASGEAMAQIARSKLAVLAEAELARKLDHWHNLLSHGGAVDGLSRTMAALRDGLAADLFIVDRPGSAASAWVGPNGQDLSLKRDDLRERGVPDPVKDRADAAMVRAVAVTSAELDPLPGGPPEAGATLRYGGT
jgi:hypothetical protein